MPKRISGGRAALCLWPFAFAAALTWSTGRFGFDPTDDEFILAGSWRILHGEVPHRDIISARPMGSSILHLVDFAIPGPLFLVGRLTTAFELVVATAALLALATKPYRRWTESWRVLVPLSIAATVLNMHIFPLTPWHTIDGVALTAVGWYLLDDGLRTGSARRRRSGLVLVGAALVCKQSFAPALAIAVILLLIRRAGWLPEGSARRRTRAWSASLAWLCAAPLAYAAWVIGAGGLSDALGQLDAGQPVWGRRMLIDVWTMLAGDARALAVVLVFLAAAFSLVLAGSASRADGRKAPSSQIAPGTADGSRSDGRKARWIRLAARTAGGSEAGGRTSPWVRLAARTVLSLIIAATALGTALARPGSSVVPRLSGHVPDTSVVLWWMLAALIAADYAATRRLLIPGCLVCALAWMASLSWGYDVPALLTGSLAATSLVVIWRTADQAEIRGLLHLPPSRGLALATACVAFISAAFTVAVVDHERALHEYRDLPKTRLDTDLSVVAPDGRGIRTSADDASYLLQLAACVRSHPARWTAVLPDNAAVYPLLGLRDPFPIDWMYDPEMVGDAAARIQARAVTLDQEGDYLVLFQTGTAGVPRTDPSKPLYPFDYPLPLLQQVRADLRGAPVVCGPFTGVWQAAPR